jgi:hypothetical protein
MAMNPEMSLFSLRRPSIPHGTSGRVSSDRLANVEAKLSRAQAQVKALTVDLETVTAERDELASAPANATLAQRLLASVPNVECVQCHRSYPNFPALWPGGFHGSTEPICTKCKPESEYQS